MSKGTRGLLASRNNRKEEGGIEVHEKIHCSFQQSINSSLLSKALELLGVNIFKILCNYFM